MTLDTVGNTGYIRYMETNTGGYEMSIFDMFRRGEISSEELVEKSKERNEKASERYQQKKLAKDLGVINSIPEYETDEEEWDGTWD